MIFFRRKFSSHFLKMGCKRRATCFEKYSQGPGGRDESSTDCLCSLLSASLGRSTAVRAFAGIRGFVKAETRSAKVSWYLYRTPDFKGFLCERNGDSAKKQSSRVRPYATFHTTAAHSVYHKKTKEVEERKLFLLSISEKS